MALPSPQYPISSGDDAAQCSDPEDQELGNTPPTRGRQDYRAQPRTQQDDCTQQKSVSENRQPTVSFDSVIISSEVQSRKEKSRQEHSPHPTDIKSRAAHSRWQEVKMLLTRSYRDLLNKDIEVVREMSHADPSSLVPSQIGASFWSAREKDALFRRMAFRGPHDLPLLCQAVPTKSETEIQTYISLLQKGTHDPSAIEPSLADIPAAIEISKNCENTLESAADALEIFVNEHEAQLERERYGNDYWIIDEQQATMLEDHFDSIVSADSLTHDGEESQHDDPTLGEHLPSHSTTAAALLRPASLLQLSRQFFMNHGSDNALNWYLLTACSTASNEPSLFRSAFDYFHNLIISITRRLVQAAIIQATSRLRAQDSSRQDWNPAASVRKIDVDSAISILNMPSWRHYWIKMARRCQVKVYSESKRYNDGRPETKSGIRGRQLTYDEVEAELRGEQNAYTQPITNGDDVNEDDVDYAMDEDDLFTDASNHEVIEAFSAEVIDGHSSSRNTKRKRSRSTSSFYRLEETYLQALDYNATVEEEKGLWNMLGWASNSAATASMILPHSPGAKPEEERSGIPWRQKLDFESEWEHREGHLSDCAFEEMGRRGVLGHKRRRLLVKRVQERLQPVLTNTEENLTDDETLMEMRIQPKRPSITINITESDHETTTESEKEADSTTSDSDLSRQSQGIYLS